ncbi:MAG TPA: helix-turn-helix domain-containing protein [Allosphingosinicella sp.]|nr:helix-turn-helix domain-containing protein [Allosphingosinicella sp.]
MAFSTDHVGDELLESINRPFRNLSELLDALMRALAERTPLVAGSLWVRGAGTLQLRRVERKLLSDWVAESRSVPAPKPRHRPGPLVLPIAYADVPLGEIRLEMDPQPHPSDPETELLRHFARQCGLLIKRYEVRRWSERRLGRPLLLVGMSKALRELESFLEISARGRLPVLLRGEFGTEKAQLAATIHCCGPTADGPFVQIDCAEPCDTPAKWMERAEGGTLFLSDVDELDPRLQKQLPQHLPSRLHQWLAGSGAPQVRVVASTTADLHERAREGLFSRSLLAELDFLSATIPPLRDRPDDIESLIYQALERNGYRAPEKCTDSLIAHCRTHDWPENLFELERVIARLAVMTGSRPIQLDDISRHAPAVASADEAGRAAADTAEGGVSAAALDRWVHCAIEGDDALMNGLHQALRRALANLGARYAEPISLDQLARHAGVSPSHLSYLFRSALGMSFKMLLGHIRISKARELLAAGAGPNITQVAMSVGFSDLSHFERSFRRIVGQSPREYRRSAAAH